jgi:hypothetical protein
VLPRIPSEPSVRSIVKADFGVIATLQDDILHFVNELKFLLLFYDRPHAYLLNTGLSFIG